MSSKVRVWDLPTRLFHWLLLALVICLWLTAETGEMQWHMIFAYCLGGLLIFRLIWGVIGSQTSRFSDFIKSPLFVLRYVAKLPSSGIIAHQGHNPLGGYMVVALLAVLCLQFSSGLFATDEIFTEGPLYSTISPETSDFLTWLHKINFNLLLGLVVVHILAVLLHQLKGDSLLKPMLSGYRQMEQTRSLFFKSTWLALALATVIVVLIGYLFIWPVYSSI